MQPNDPHWQYLKFHFLENIWEFHVPLHSANEILQIQLHAENLKSGKHINTKFTLLSALRSSLRALTCKVNINLSRSL
jgi:hypothetical protein